MSDRMINIAKDFSPTPGGRLRGDSQFSGESFREDFLMPVLRDTGDIVTVVLDGVEGFGSSFLDEAFGGLVRKHHLKPETLRARLRVVAHDPVYRRYADRVWTYIDEAAH